MTDYLVDPAWLEANLNHRDLAIVDVDTEAAYLRGHIPGAAALHPDYERDPDSGWVSTMPPEKFAEVCRGLGIGDDSQVVIYDNNMSLHATRLWWVLKRYGHRNVRVLDGGWRAWQVESRPVSFQRPSPKKDVAFTPRPDGSTLATLDDVKAACSLDEAVIWDVRTGGEYDGSINRGNRRAGHIAGAVHLEWSDLMDAETHKFRSLEEARTILHAGGITMDKAAYAY